MTTTTGPSAQLKQIDYLTTLAKAVPLPGWLVQLSKLRPPTLQLPPPLPRVDLCVFARAGENSHNKFNFLVLLTLFAWASLFPIYSRHTSLCPAERYREKSESSFCEVCWLALFFFVSFNFLYHEVASLPATPPGAVAYFNCLWGSFFFVVLVGARKHYYVRYFSWLNCRHFKMKNMLPVVTSTLVGSIVWWAREIVRC